MRERERERGKKTNCNLIPFTPFMISRLPSFLTSDTKKKKQAITVILFHITITLSLSILKKKKKTTVFSFSFFSAAETDTRS